MRHCAHTTYRMYNQQDLYDIIMVVERLETHEVPMAKSARISRLMQRNGLCYGAKLCVIST